MALSSALFTRKGPGTDLLKRCAAIPAGHFFRGMPVNDAQKDAVIRIQTALSQLGFQVSDPAGVFGASTAEKVLAYKGSPRNILGPGQLQIGTIGPVARQLNVTLPMPSLKDQALGTTLTTGDFKMQGQTRKR